MKFLIMQSSPVPFRLSVQNLGRLQEHWIILVIDELIIIFIFWWSTKKYWDISLKQVNQCFPPYPWQFFIRIHAFFKHYITYEIWRISVK